MRRPTSLNASLLLACLTGLGAFAPVGCGAGGDAAEAIVASAVAVAPYAITASGDDGNVPANVADGKLDTRWSSFGKGQWIQFDLGEVRKVSRVRLAWYLGIEQLNEFQIQTSLDGQSFRTVFTGTSSSTLALQSYTFAGHRARFVRVVVNGNSQNDWASITEMQTFATATTTDAGSTTDAGGTTDAGSTTDAATVTDAAPPPPPPPPPSGCIQPDATNTGASGSQTAYAGPSVITTDGTVVDGKNITGDLRIQANNVTLRNSTVSGGIYVDAGSYNTKIQHNTAQRVSISSAQTVLVEFNDLGFSSNDATHVTSDGGSMASNITLRNNYIHDPRPGAGEHWDGLQVRGVNGITVFCNNFQFGAPDQEHFNSPVYLEGGANGGITDAVIDNNWLFGGAFGFMYGADNDGKTQLTNNHFGGTYVWQSADSDSACYSPDAVPAVQTGNDLRGVPFTPCRR